MTIIARLFVFLTLAYLVLGCHSFGASVQAQELTDSSSLANFLDRNQLQRLSLRLLETEYSRELDNSKRNKLALDLADRYRKYFFANVTANGEQDFILRAESLIRDFPIVATAKLQVAISHARYIVAENAFLDWWRNGGTAQTQDVVRVQFETVLNELNRQLRNENADLERAIAGFPINEFESAQRQKQIDDAEARIIHANYLKGWACYFLGIIPHDLEHEYLKSAQQSFYRALQIEQRESIDSIDSKWLDFSTPISQRVLAGLGMVYAAQNHDLASQFCFKKNNSLERKPVHRFNSLAYCRRWEKAVLFAEEVESNELPKSDAAIFWSSVLNAGYAEGAATKNVAAENGANQLQRLGFLGLLRRFEADLISQFISRRNMDLRDDLAEDLWIKGLVHFQRANSDTQMLNDAAGYLNASLEVANEHLSNDDRSRIKYLLAMIDFRNNRFRSVSDRLQGLVIAGNHPDELVERILWLHCLAMIELSVSDNRIAARALSAVNEMQSRFPNSERAERLNFEKMKLTNQLLPPKEAMQNLKKIKENDEFYAESQFEFVKNQYRLWSLTHRARASKDEGEHDAFTDLRTFDARLRGLQNVQPTIKLASLVMVLNASIRRDAPETTIEALLEDADKIAVTIPSVDKRSKSSLLYYRFLADRKFKNVADAKRSAVWLAENSTNEQFKVSALAFLASTMEQESVEPAQLISIYERLSNKLGTDLPRLQESTNARVATNRLVQLYIQSNQLEKAERLNQLLLKANPDHQQFLLNAARISFRLGNINTSLPIWRRLALGSQDGSDAWLEAKHGLIQCLIQSDAQMAKKLWQQTVSLSGAMPDEWKAKFDSLADDLKLIESQFSTLQDE